jgi:hypothetical protein
MSLAKNIAWRMKMTVLKFPRGYCWGYTKWVYQRRSPKPASPGGPSGWYGGLPTGRPSCWKPTAVLDAGAYGGSEDRPMAGCLVVHA